VDPGPIQNGIPLYKKMGYCDSILSMIDARGKTRFSNDFFHFIFSNQVLEHVRDMEAVASELRRITAWHGVGYHIYPGHRRPVEGHLFMPFIHWLPKNRIRKYVILICVSLGIEPKWESVKDRNFKDKANVYFRYSVNKTYYRKYADVAKIFEKLDFLAHYEMTHYSKAKENKAIQWLSKSHRVGQLIHHLLLTFRSVELITTKL